MEEGEEKEIRKEKEGKKKVGYRFKSRIHIQKERKETEKSLTEK